MNNHAHVEFGWECNGEVYKVANTQKTVTRGTPSWLPYTLRPMRGDYMVGIPSPGWRKSLKGEQRKPIAGLSAGHRELRQSLMHLKTFLGNWSNSVMWQGLCTFRWKTQGQYPLHFHLPEDSSPKACEPESTFKMGSHALLRDCPQKESGYYRSYMRIQIELFSCFLFWLCSQRPELLRARYDQAQSTLLAICV